MILIVDTREQKPYSNIFKKLKQNYLKKKLDIGDYSIKGFETKFSIERKTLNDFICSITRERQRFENELKKRGVDPKNLALMTDKVFAYYTSAKPGSARGKAKKLKTKLERIYHDGRLGLILDGTGHDFGKIAKKKKRLEQLGYDTSMLFINTSLQVAQERNKSRDRTLPEDLLEKMWQDVQNNMGKFQTLFGSKFHILDNSEMGDFSKMHNDKIKAVTKMIKAPLKNPIGKQWIEDAQKLKRLQ